MSEPCFRRGTGGFTLIEVVVALFVIALGIGALMTTLASSADSVGHLREKSFAEWVALNRISELRLGSAAPAVGIVTGTTEYAGSNWRWRQEISDQGIAGILRIDISVATAATAGVQAAATTAETEFAALATAYGFIGTSVMKPSGIDPDWSLASVPGPGTPPPGGAPPPDGAPSTGKTP
ncbi:MAG: type II secretion system minor pseudopilin GspI [Steroidobacteraceae bacterium]